MDAPDARLLLAVHATASPSEVKAAYRQMLKLWHPDRFASDSAVYSEAIRRTQHINAAYRTLERRARGQELQQNSAHAPPTRAWKRPPLRTIIWEWWPILISVVMVGLASVISELLG